MPLLLCAPLQLLQYARSECPALLISATNVPSSPFLAMESHTSQTALLRCLGTLQTYALNNFTVRSTVVSPKSALRQQIVNGLFELVCNLHYSAKTAQLACIYMDEAATVLGLSTVSKMRQLSAICLQLASKFEERSQLDVQTLTRIAGISLSADGLILMESGTLQALYWDLDRLTAAEVSRVALAFSAPNQDFRELIKESDEFASVGYTDSEIAGAGPVVIGLAAVCCSFERRSSLESRDNWLEIVLPALGVTKAAVLTVSDQVWNYLAVHFQVTRPTNLIDGSE